MHNLLLLHIYTYPSCRMPVAGYYSVAKIDNTMILQNKELRTADELTSVLVDSCRQVGLWVSGSLDNYVAGSAKFSASTEVSRRYFKTHQPASPCCSFLLYLY